jgi:hypothetical protein
MTNFDRIGYLDPRSDETTVTGLKATPIFGPRVAFVASYSAEPRFSRSLIRLVSELQQARYEVILILAQDSPEDIKWPSSPKTSPLIVQRKNLGYDFGSWAVGMELFPQAMNAKYVILANDSMAGPFSSLTPLIADFESSTADVWGITRTEQFEPHLQSYVLGFHNGVLADALLRKFWRRIPLFDNKEAIVAHFEIGLSEFLAGEAYSTAAFVYPVQLTAPRGNPTIESWSQLLLMGVPFVKRQLVNNPSLSRTGHLIESKVRELFGENVRDWI